MPMEVSSLTKNLAQGKRYKSTAKSIPDQNNGGVPRFAVLGGGITGLSTAHYLTREFPRAKITIYEGSDRLGGWLNSKKVNVKHGEVVFEQGPRSLRPHTPAALVTLDMIKNLKLEDQVLITPHHSVAAQNRFIYYPDHLVKMPGPGQDIFALIWTLLSEPVFKGLLRGAFFEFNQPPRLANLEDESIGSFLTRRLGSAHPGDNIVSAVLHGIYAGDIYQLSVKSLLSRPWHQEAAYGSITQAMLKTGKNGKTFITAKDKLLEASLLESSASFPGDTASLADSMSGASVYTFKGGLGAFSDAIAASLTANPNVQIKTNLGISELEYETDSKSVTIKTLSSHPSSNYTHCISTLPAYALAAIADPHLPALKFIRSVTVMVVNLYYASPNVLPEAGFGYLIPRSIPFDQNPECALGVVFDSYSSVGQDTAPGTKLTVMLGGHWWDSFSSDEYPTEEEGAQMAKALLKRHLHIDEEPEKILVGLHKDCIPQYTVGHEERLKKTHDDLRSAFGGKLSVAGSWIDGVGLNDCVRGARDVVMNLASSIDDGMTGLEEFQRPRVWVETETAAYKKYQELRRKKEAEMERR